MVITLYSIMKRNEMIKAYELAEQEYANSAIGIREISKKYCIDRSVFTGWLLAKGYTIQNKRSSKSFNINYFDSIDTEEKAYWLGFLFADGAITKNKNSYSIEFCLKREDREHVKLFAKAISKEHIIETDNYRTRCVIGSKHMFEVLEALGCTRKKSLTLKFPENSIFKDKSLIRHFIRGYVEGDGCLSYCDKEHKNPNITILGTQEFLDGIQLNYGSDHILSTSLNRNPITKVLSYSGKSGYKFAKWLYKDATIYLNRKFLKYIEYCRLYEESYRLLQDKIGGDCNVNTEQTIDILQGSIAA